MYNALHKEKGEERGVCILQGLIQLEPIREKSFRSKNLMDNIKD